MQIKDLLTRHSVPLFCYTTTCCRSGTAEKKTLDQPVSETLIVDRISFYYIAQKPCAAVHALLWLRYRHSSRCAFLRELGLFCVWMPRCALQYL